MASIREMRQRIRSVKNLAQVTKALETVSASYVRKATQKVQASRPYADKAWELLLHLASQPGHTNLHPLLANRPEVNSILVVMITSDRGLAGAYNINMFREVYNRFGKSPVPVSYVAVGKKGRDMLIRRRMSLIADFIHLPGSVSYIDVSPIGRLVVDDFLKGDFDEVYLGYTHFHSMARQEPTITRLLPLEVKAAQENGRYGKVEETNHRSVFSYEPGQEELLSDLVPRFISLQVYHAVLSAQASEHAARMVAMRNASDNASELIKHLNLEYNKVRQNMITNDMLDIAGGAEALSQAAEE
ncbi:MAG TPA: ATP synthase F1 subunit gamma [Chloroflexi bacterium]|nr:ATP synthase F1 subunit gamma [Chloroflexota bacterium]